MDYDVTCVIPRWGRTFVRSMGKFAQLARERDEIQRVVDAVLGGKAQANEAPAAA